jgi:predicted ABC-type ATPase
MSIINKIKRVLPFQKKKGVRKACDGPLTYTVFAGINGAGKTSLYNVLRDSGELGERINIDEIAMGMGSWRDTVTQIKAARQAMSQISDCIEQRVSFHQETTLPGPTITKHIKIAKEADFNIRLYYVGVDSLDTCIERVHHRVRMGGHGIDDDIIRRRFEKIIGELRELLPLCDEVVFYDNTVRFRQIAMMKDGVCIDADRDLPQWFWQLGIDVPSDRLASPDIDIKSETIE